MEILLTDKDIDHFISTKKSDTGNSLTRKSFVAFVHPDPIIVDTVYTLADIYHILR